MRARLSLNDADICVGFVGRMIPGKAPGTLLEAFALARRGLAFPAKLVFVGSGPEGHSLQNRIEELRLQDEVFLAGELNGLQAMAAFDIFVLPSLSEAFPYVLLEALSLGLPVISTDVGGVSELVHEGCNGFVTKKSAPREMATALRKLLVDVGLRSKMGEASKRICGQFSLARMADRVMQLYQELLS
jgi:glycosyltransferase involved in cell wall biosynthesis